MDQSEEVSEHVVWKRIKEKYNYKRGMSDIHTVKSKLNKIKNPTKVKSTGRLVQSTPIQSIRIRPLRDCHYELNIPITLMFGSHGIKEVKTE